ncbi:MAG: hypothetical protein HWD59_10755 [Coxiellaceae bacterium]|nr:MAG: hypothetical protein HWD59_10755 [Coxiellaceae bacterium]
MKGFNALVDVIGCMKLNYMSALAKANIWGNSELLAEVGLVDSLGAVP